MNYDSTPKKQKRPVSGSAVVRIVIWSVVLLILCAIFVLGVVGLSFKNLGLSFSNFSIGGYTYDDARSYAVGNGTTDAVINELDIDWLDGDIEILPTDESSITITEDYSGEDDDERLRWKVEEGELKIKYRKPYWAIGVMSGPSEKKLTIYIPRAMLDAMDEVDVDTVESKVTFEGNAKEFSFDSVDGHLVATGDIREMNLDSVEARVDFTGSVGHVNLDGVEITATMHITKANSFDIDGVDNQVTLYLAESITGFAVRYDSVGGNVTLNGYEDVSKRDKYDHYWGDGSLKIDMDGVDAKLTIEKETID